VAVQNMEYNYPTAQDPSQEQPNPPHQQQQQQTASRGRGRRAYAAQQYDFNVPSAGSMYNQQPQQPYPAPGYPAAAPAAVGVQSQQQGQPQVYGQPQTYAQPGYQYGQDYQAPSPNMYQQPYPGQVGGVAGVTNQMQHLHVSQVAFSPCLKYVLLTCSPLL
jgi:hypothetical protein